MSDEYEEQTYLDVGDTFKVKGITYKVVKSKPSQEKFEISCIKTSSRNISKLKMSNYVSYEDVDYKVVSVGKNAFANCKKLKTVTLASTITSIGEKAFYKCTSLNKITIPGKTKKIGKNAFAKCNKLSYINIKSKLLTSKNVGKQAFAGIHKKAVVKVPSGKKSSYRKWLKKKGLTGKYQKVK